MKTIVTAVSTLALLGALSVNAGNHAMDEHEQMMHDKKVHDMDEKTMQLMKSNSLYNMHPDDLEGMDIMGPSGKQIGDVDEIVRGGKHRRWAVIGLEDSLKEVVVPLTSLTLSADKKTLSTKMTHEDLEKRVDYDPWDMKSVAE